MPCKSKENEHNDKKSPYDSQVADAIVQRELQSMVKKVVVGSVILYLGKVFGIPA